MLTDNSLGVIPGRPKGELWCAIAHLRISLHNLEIPDSPLTRRSGLKE